MPQSSQFLFKPEKKLTTIAVNRPHKCFTCYKVNKKVSDFIVCSLFSGVSKLNLKVTMSSKSALITYIHRPHFRTDSS